MAPSNFNSWSGDIDAFCEKAASLLAQVGRPEPSPPTIRLIRDYMRRGILGETRKQGREVVFDRVNLVRFVAARFLLHDGWPLSKIAEHFSMSSQADIEAILPNERQTALSAVERIRGRTRNKADGGSAGGLHYSLDVGRNVARMSTIEAELRNTLEHLGIDPVEGAVEEMTLIAMATWCQVLVQTDRISQITADEAEHLGRLLTTQLLALKRKRSGRK